MKHLLLARHGDYDGGSKRLNERGREQAIRLSEAILECWGDVPLVLVTSTAPRAIDSAEAIAKRLGLSAFDEEPYL